MNSKNRIRKDRKKNNEFYDRLVQVFQGLPVHNRYVYNMYVIDEYSLEQISSSLGLSIQEARNTLHEARLLLYKSLKANWILDFDFPHTDIDKLVKFVANAEIKGGRNENWYKINQLLNSYDNAQKKNNKKVHP